MSSHERIDPVTRPTIFITGAAAGIGRATAELFAANGWFVGLYDVAEAEVRALRQQLGAANAVAGRLDVSDAAAFADAVQDFHEAAGGRLDVMFNCAGLLSVGDFESITPQRHAQLVNVNICGVINGCHAALPYLRGTPNSRVINMASASALYGTPGFASYSATKFAVRALTEALDIEWAKYGIRVMDLLPPFVDTPMIAGLKQGTTFRRLGVKLNAQDIAAVVWRAANWQATRRVHWYPNLQIQMLAVLQKYSPATLNRLTLRLLSGY